jgi:hypothetical protein
MPINGHRVIWYPLAGVLSAEGHPGGKDKLAGVEALPGYVAAMSRALWDHGVQVPEQPMRFDHSTHGFAGVGRLDLTVNLQTDSTPVGLAIMGGVAAIQPNGRLQTVVRRQKGGRAIETVTWQGTRGIVARTYDKSVEAASGPRATLLRFEDQRRWPGGHRRDVEELDAVKVRSIFHSRFAPLWQAAKGVHVVTVGNAAQRIGEAVRAEEITPGEAVDAAGHLMLAQADVRVGSRATQWRHRQIAKRLGLVLVDGELVEEEVDVDLADVLEQVLDGEHWAQG